MHGRTFGQSESMFMAKRDILDWNGISTGDRIARYVWRSKPTHDPVTGRAVRCIVAQDEKGKYWAATRTGYGNGQKAICEYWDSWDTAQKAQAVSREATRGLISTRAELYANTVTGKRPGEQIIKVTMDDGWSVAINAPGKTSPAEQRTLAMIDRIGKGKQTRPEAPARRRDRAWPSR
jgi:hypothetical protein